MRTLLIKRQKVNNKKLKLAKEFRKKMTLAEKAFWNMVRQNQIEGLHFRRQQVIHGFIADFYCNEIGLVIEIDGGIHEQQKGYDELRDHIITAYGVKVIRFTNEEVLDKSDWVVKRLKEETREAVNK
ncbi:MAG: DUF559 domain-containing protein [Candidatus Edwardsbacteria bacterium]|nr:DUF559 domain-containing protein [Candidatus Edwardsbacteria bacterium]